MTVAGYLRQLQELLPRGKLFASLGVKFVALLEALAEEFQLDDDFIRGAFAETNPLTATYTLEEWEEKYGLPNDGTIDERRTRIAARRASRRRTRPEDYRQRFAALLGLAPADVQVIEISSALAVYTGHPREVYRFAIFRDPELPGSYVLADAEALIEDYVQSHLLGKIVESTCARCDNAYSLCDRDLLEAPERMADDGLPISIPYAATQLLWVESDDYRATFDELRGYAALRNRGTLGGDLVPAVGAGPARALVAGKLAPNAGSTGGWRFGDTESLTELHEPGTSATLTFAIGFSSLNDCWIFGTRDSSATSRGVRLELLGSELVFKVSDGVTDTLVLTSPTLDEATWYVGHVRKVDDLFELFLDGVLVDSGTATALTSGAHQSVVWAASSPTDLFTLRGRMPAFGAAPWAMSTQEMLLVQQYLTRWNDASALAPEFLEELLTEDGETLLTEDGVELAA